MLMNYKRTVEDFKKCGSKAGTVYGLPYVSDCVGNSELNLKCDDLAYPVPCSDGKCHTDYISCLRVSLNSNVLVAVLVAYSSLIVCSHLPILLRKSQTVNYISVFQEIIMRSILNIFLKTLHPP